jgi:folate-binding protein YgfZ
MSTERKTLRESPLHADSEALGATFGEWFGCRLPSRYSDVAEEITAAQKAAVFLDTNYRGFLSLTGPDRVRYLNAVTTADIKSLAEGEGNVGLLLNPQGHILAEIETYALENRLLLVSHASTLARTEETLERFIIMDDCTLENVSLGFGSLAVEGPKARAVMTRLCGAGGDSLPSSAWSPAAAEIAGAACRVVRHAFYSGAGSQDGFEIFARPEQLGVIWRAVAEAGRAEGGAPIGYEALNVLRLEAGVPWFGYDFNDRVIPHEAGVEVSHISYTKGCYTGQEIVERVRSRGHVNRRRTMLLFQGAAVPPPLAPLRAGAAEAGFVTSAAFSPLRGAVIGMGYVRREYGQPGSRLECAGGTAEVIEMPAAGTAAPNASGQ